MPFLLWWKKCKCLFPCHTWRQHSRRISFSKLSWTWMQHLMLKELPSLCRNPCRYATSLEFTWLCIGWIHTLITSRFFFGSAKGKPKYGSLSPVRGGVNRHISALRSCRNVVTSRLNFGTQRCLVIHSARLQVHILGCESKETSVVWEGDTPTSKCLCGRVLSVAERAWHALEEGVAYTAIGGKKEWGSPCLTVCWRAQIAVFYIKKTI